MRHPVEVVLDGHKVFGLDYSAKDSPMDGVLLADVLPFVGDLENFALVRVE